MTALSVTPANVLKGAGAKTFDGTAGTTITAGQAVYKDPEDGYKFKLATSANQTAARAVGIALHAATDEQPLQVLTDGTYAPGATAASGTVYVVGATAGAIAPVADVSNSEYLTILGVGNADGDIDLSIFASGNITPAA
ncbi:MAG: hypothetical protein RLP44_02475 [Aggregatilineales bacterium]